MTARDLRNLCHIRLALLQAGKLSLAANINTTDVGEIHHVEIPKEDIDLFNNDPAWHSEIEELQSQYQPYRDLYQKLNSGKHDDGRYKKNGNWSTMSQAIWMTYILSRTRRSQLPFVYFKPQRPRSIYKASPLFISATCCFMQCMTLINSFAYVCINALQVG